MKLAGAASRYFLGLMFLVFGLNDFFHFIPMGKLPAGPAGDFLGLLMTTHFVYFVGIVMGVSGILLLFNRFVALGLTLLGPVLANILVFHLTMNPSGIGLGAFATLLWLLVAWQHKAAFAGILKAKL